MQVRTIGPGDVFGEECLYEEHRWEASTVANSSAIMVLLPRQLLENILQGRKDIEAPVKRIIALRDSALEQSTLTHMWPFTRVPHDLLDEIGTAFDQANQPCGAFKPYLSVLGCIQCWTRDH